MAWAPDYCTSAELKAYIRVGDTIDDTQIALAVTAASRAVDQHCNRQFGRVASAVERFFTPWYDRRRARWVVDIDDLMSTTSLAVSVGDTALDVAEDITLGPRNAAGYSRPWTEIVIGTDATVHPTGTTEDEVSVTANFGWLAVPDPVKQATLLQASRILSRRDSPYGIAGSPADGSEMRLLAKVDPDVAVVLAGFRRWWAAR